MRWKPERNHDSVGAVAFFAESCSCCICVEQVTRQTRRAALSAGRLTIPKAMAYFVGSLRDGQGDVSMQPLLRQRVRMHVHSDLYISTEDEDTVHHLYVKGKCSTLILIRISPLRNSRYNST